MVSPLEWGPNAWELLHGLAEKVGHQQHISMIRDERNEMTILLKTFWHLLPCKKCQEHYREWLVRHPPDRFLSNTTEDMQDGFRKWLYELHNSVNQRNEGTIEFPEEALQETYSHVNLRECANKLKTVYQRGVQSHVLKPEEWKKAWKHLDLLIRLL